MEQPGTDRLDAPFVGMILTLVLGAVLALMNTTLIGVVIPNIASSLDAAPGSLSWVGTAYVLGIAVAIAASAWATTVLGVRTTWLIALTVFAVGTAAAALAPSTGALIGARAVQGLGGGLLEPVMLTAIAQAAGPRRMGRAMGLVAGVIALGPLLGPLLGGLGAETLDWRWTFAAFLPLSLLAMAASARLVPTGRREPRQLDFVGLSLLSLGSVAVLLGLSRGSAPGGFDILTWVGIPAGLLLYGGLGVWLRARGRSAIIDLAPTRTRGFLPGTTIFFLLGTSIYPLFYGLPQFFRGALETGALASGLLLLPQGLGAMIGMVAGGRLSDYIAARPVVSIGALLALLGNLGFLLLGASAPLAAYLVVLSVAGLGVGLVGGPTMAAVYRVLPEADVPSASTIIFIANQLGGALGIAVIAILIGTSGWTATIGTTPMVLPVIGCAAIAVLAQRLRT